ncbi:hypothetical protein F4X10_17640 [Candidatus Poribacteria bacterium]|nr:hypothetical protein [Candidatus Poribacteria bacterium]
MRKASFLLFVATLFLLASYASSEVVFYADFEKGSLGIPGDFVNDVGNYKSENRSTFWEYSDFEGREIGGQRSLIQIGEGCRTTGNTNLPGVKSFNEGIIQVIFSFGDDDSFGVKLQTGRTFNGYVVVFGYNESAILALLGYVPKGKCPEFNNGVLKSVPHGLGGGLDQANQVPYFGRIVVKDGKLQVWYMKLEDVPNLYGSARSLGRPKLEYNEKLNLGGAVGLWHESWGHGKVDSILITDRYGFEPTLWENNTLLWEEVKREDAPAKHREYVRGDLNKNGQVELEDVKLMRMAIRHPALVRGWGWDVDLNDDGEIDEADVQIVKQKAVEAIVAAAPSLQRKKVGTWGALKRRYKH